MAFVYHCYLIYWIVILELGLVNCLGNVIKLKGNGKIPSEMVRWGNII